MNNGGVGVGVGGGYGGNRKAGRGPAPLPSRVKDRDEDLILFRDMLNMSEKDRTVSLLQPVSDEFEPTGNYALYRMASGKKGEFVSEKNDYDWLKTPPATPLFPSLELETNSPQLILQREITITQPLSRFAGNLEATKKESGASEVESNFQKVPPRSITPIGRSNRISISNTEKRTIKSAPVLSSNTKITSTSSQSGSTKVNTSSDSSDNKHLVEKSKPIKSMNQKESQMNFISSNLSKSMQENGTDSSSKSKPKARGISPQVTRPKVVPDRTPSVSRVRQSIFQSQYSTNPNSTTVPARATSASRARHSISQSQSQTIPILEEKRAEPMMKGRRQSSSPSVNRGRRAGPLKQDVHTNDEQHREGNVFGSRMVDKFLNARKLCAEERELTKQPNKGGLYGSMNESSGFGRIISKSSLDMAVKHMEIKREPITFRQLGTATGRKFTSK